MLNDNKDFLKKATSTVLFTEQQQNLTDGDLESTAPVIQELFTASVKTQLQYCNKGCRMYMHMKKLGHSRKTGGK